MKRKVKLSLLAQKKLDKLLEYLLASWSEKVRNDFIKKLDHSIAVIRLKPEAFPQSSKQKGLFKCVITKQTTLFYRFNSKQINIVTVFGTRQNPKKLYKETNKT